MNLKIIQTHNKASIWPGKDNAMLVTCIDGSGKTYQATIPIAEYNLSVFIQRLMTDVPMTEIKQLVDLVEAYGEECYEKAGTERSFDDAGADL